MPAAACWTRASRMHGIMTVQLAGSPAVASRPAEAALCFEVACEHPDARLPSAICQMWRELTAHTAGPYQHATNASFRLDGRDLLAPCASLPPCLGTSRGRMRGVGATCTAPTTHGRSKRMRVPECCKIGAGCKQRRRRSVRTATLASQRPVARGFASRSTDWAGRVQAYASTLEIRATMRVFRGPGDRQAPIFRQESEGGIRRRMRRQPGGESGWRWSLGMGPSGRAAGTYGARFDGSHRGLGNGGCCEVGKAAGELFDAAARDDQHKYADRSLRETSRGICRAAPGAPPPLKTPKCGGWDRPGFVVATPWS
jgi:hypothetical protein